MKRRMVVLLGLVACIVVVLACSLTVTKEIVVVVTATPGETLATGTALPAATEKPQSKIEQMAGILEKSGFESFKDLDQGCEHVRCLTGIGSNVASVGVALIDRGNDLVDVSFYLLYDEGISIGQYALLNSATRALYPADATEIIASYVFIRPEEDPVLKIVNGLVVVSDFFTPDDGGRSAYVFTIRSDLLNIAPE